MQDKRTQSKTFCDTHVHIYNCFDLGNLLDSAAENFRHAANVAGANHYASVIMLTETSHDDYFAKLAEVAVTRCKTKWPFDSMTCCCSAR